ncbi:hypothetical protein BDN72DRAFT_778676 [Pluteus cervinus]|uniref:Uncharacterized protein n=1 Tax=Pluteus cervinus TaxID=181527 RepID=A0ACD3A640_9AGAR|nr:hypothetical protein BDN72DRAFT_778676 [Pluteus cervinus]
MYFHSINLIRLYPLLPTHRRPRWTQQSNLNGCAPISDILVLIRTFTPAISVTSTKNTMIESFWHWLREKLGLSLKDCILKGKDAHIFQPQIALHRDLTVTFFYWVFVPLVQSSLDDFKTYWNQHRIRYQADKILPSGHVPDDARENPSSFGGLNCLIPVDNKTTTGSEARQYLTEEVGGRDQHLSWYSNNSALDAEIAHRAIGSPEMTLSNAWDVFLGMSNFMQGR